MIEIIKEGTKRKIKCPHCGCLFSYEEEDVKMEPKKYEGYQPGLEYVTCPQKGCGEKVYVGARPKTPRIMI